MKSFAQMVPVSNYFGVRWRHAQGKLRGTRNRARRLAEEIGYGCGVMAASRSFTNREGHDAFNFSLPFRNPTPGVSAMLRVKNEASKITYALTSIYDLFDEIVVVDNASTDATVELVKRFKERHDGAGRVKLGRYPFAIARVGAENQRTPIDSVHSSAYFYNYCSSLCTRRFLCKWDGDMVVIQSVLPALRRALGRMSPFKAYLLFGQTLYRDASGGFIATTEINREVRIAELSYRYAFHSMGYTQLWGATRMLPNRPLIAEPAFYELKFTQEDEFSHWSSGPPNDVRAKVEWENFHKIKRGQIELTWKRFPHSYLDDQLPASLPKAVS